MDESTLGGFGIGERIERVEFGVIGANRGQPATRAQVDLIVIGDHPVAAGDLPIRTMPVAPGFAVESLEVDSNRPQADQLCCVREVTDLRSTAQTPRILEEQQLSTHQTRERLHELKLMAIDSLG